MVDNTVWKLALRGDEPMRGAKEALVTLVVYSDYQCPFCKRVEPTMDQILEKYGDSVRQVWKNNPLAFHKNARISAQATCAAGAQGKFWELHKVLFDNNQKLEKEDLLGYAKTLGLDMAKFEADFAGEACAKAIDDDVKLASEVGARGTPNIYINGRQLRGALPFEQIEPIIQEEMTKAKALVEKGTALASVYDEIVKAGKVFTPLDEAVFEFKAPAPFKGPADAPVVLTVFSDFQCPFCSRITKTEYEVFNMFPGKAKLEFRNFPLSFHKDAHLAAQASLAAEAQGKFWEMHDKLFENQKALTRPDLDKYAGELGLDVDKFKKALDDGAYKAAVDAQMKEGEAAGVRGTPSIYLNGRKFQAADREAATFKKIIEAEILSKL
jgi:protein-disulfide isomerase